MRGMNKSKRNVVFIVGDSGCGKSTLADKLEWHAPISFNNRVGYTTREPRPGEQDGVDYNFVDHKYFDDNVFIDQTEIAGHRYGRTAEDFSLDNKFLLAIITSSGIINVIRGLEKVGYSVNPFIVAFITTPGLLQKHGISQERINRARIQQGFLERYYKGLYKDIPVKMLSDNDVNEELYLNVASWLYKELK